MESFSGPIGQYKTEQLAVEQNEKLPATDIDSLPGGSEHSDGEVAAGHLTMEEDTSGGMGRHMGVFSATFLVIGRIVGTGIFSTPSSITAGTGSFGAAMMLWLAGLVLSFCGLFVYLELGSMIPRSGGEKVYLEAAYPRPKFLSTIVFAVQAVLLGFTASGCIVFADNVLVAANRPVGQWAARGIAISVLVSITVIHTFVPKIGVKLMNAIGSIKVIVLLLIVVSGWVVLGGHVSGVPDPGASFRDAFAGSSTSSSNYATALFKVLNSYAGWSNVGYVLNEIKDPVRTYRIAGPLGLSICSLLYILANVSYFAAATPAEIGESGVTVAAFFFGRVFGQTAKRALSVLVAISAWGNVMTVTFAQSRVNQELAKEGVIPFAKFWASTWPAGSPSAGLLLHFIPSVIVIIAIPFGDAYNFIVDLEGYPATIIGFAVAVGLVVLRWTEPNAKRPFKVWWPVVFLFLLVQAFLLVTPFIRPPQGKGDTNLPYWLYPVVGILIMTVCVLWWAVWWVIYPWIGRFTWQPIKTQIGGGVFVTEFYKSKKSS